MFENSAYVRQTRRIYAKIPVRISGRDTTGRQFAQECVTESVNAAGAAIFVQEQLAVGALVTVERLDNLSGLQARVVGRRSSNLYGVAFTAPDRTFWGLGFGKDYAWHRLSSRMQCVGCARQEDFSLNEIEYVHLRRFNKLLLDCKACKLCTHWLPVQETAEQIADRRNTRRKCIRVQASIRHELLGHVLASAIDASKDGARLALGWKLEVGEAVQIVLPFHTAGANLYVPAFIAWVKRSDTLPIEYGLQYVHHGL